MCSGPVSPRPAAARAGALAVLLCLPLHASAGIAFVEPDGLPLVVDGGSGSGLYAVAKGDFDRDGRLDVAVSGSGRVAGLAQGADHDFLAVLLGHGDGSFQPPVLVDLGAAGATQPGGLVAGDFDEDATPDLVLVAQATREVLFLHGRGDGTFGAPAAFPTGAAASCDLRAADLDRDGHLDLAVSSLMAAVNADQLAVLRGDGHGAFSAVSLHTAGRLPHALAIADVDGANGPDLLVASFESATLEVLLNDGAGRFPATATAFPARTGATGLWVADFDGDGTLDALVSGRGGVYENTCGIGCVVLLHGTGDGAFVAPPAGSVFRVEGWAMQVLADNGPLDLNGDGRPDALFTHIDGLNEVSTFLSQPGGGHATAEWVASPGAGLPAEVTSHADGNVTLGWAAGDFDGDGAPDLVVASQQDPHLGLRAGGLSLLRGVAGRPGTFQAPRVFASTRPWGGSYAAVPRGLALGELTGDAAPDLLALAGVLDVFPGLGGGLLGDPLVGLGTIGSEFYDTLRIGDVDGDGELDALWLGTDGVQGGNAPRHLLALGAGDGTFPALLALEPRTPGFAGRNGALADLDGDGDLDLVVLTSAVGFTYVLEQVEGWLNAGGHPPAFTPGQPVDVQTGTTMVSTGLAAADFDGDGRADAVAHRFDPAGGDDLVFLHGLGSGSFGPPGVVASDFAQPVDTLLAGDLDEDGRLDLVALGGWGGAYVLLGKGDGSFHPRTTHEGTAGAVDGWLGDLDGDGHLDLSLATVYGLVVRPGDGHGGLGARLLLASGVPASAALAAGDLTGDGRPELVVGHGSAANYRFLTVLENGSGPLADLALAMARTPEVVHAAEAATFTLTATNRGPDPATGVALRSPLRLGAGLASAAASQGGCAQADGLVTCTLGAIAPGGTASVTLRLRPAAPGLLWTTASVAGAVRDPDRSNDGAALSTAVAAALADLGVTLGGAPDPVTAGQPLTYSIAVSNAGPSAATIVTAVLPLPAGAAWEAATPSQGSCAQAGGQVTCQLGPLDAGSAASIAVVVRPGAAGTLEGTVTVSAAEDDPDPSDDAATARTTVQPVPAEGGGGCGCASAGPGALPGLALLLLGWRGGRRGRR